MLAQKYKKVGVYEFDLSDTLVNYNFVIYRDKKSNNKCRENCKRTFVKGQDRHDRLRPINY